MSPLVLAVLVAVPSAAGAPSRDEVLGSVRGHRIAPGESLIELAWRYDVGFNEIAAANPRLDAFVPRVGATAVIPTAWIVPAAAAPGTLVVNLSEMRLYLSSAAHGAPITFPVGVAMEGWATPLGELRVVEKSVDPVWRPTPALRREDPTLPQAVAPGPENPLGSHALRLSTTTILIHGTNRPFGVGRKVSHGCLRLYPEDIARLFALVEVGTPVRIVREPVKVGSRGGRVHVEIHEDAASGVDALADALRLLRGRGLLHRVDGRKLADAVHARSGVPVDVTSDEPEPAVDLAAG
jgi:L,D-transpeptidase ErfK/SrfK